MLLLLSVVLLGAAQDGTSFIPGESCVVGHTRAPGVCKPPSECQSATRDFQNSGIFPTYCSPTADSIRVCCSDSSTPNAAPTHGPYADSWGVYDAQASDKRLSERKCEEYSGHVFEIIQYITPEAHPKRRNISTPKCDYDGVELVVGGENAVQGEFPHMAAIGFLSAANDYVFHCGGSLISPRFVLTAGHCSKSINRNLMDPMPKIVRLGDQNLDPDVHDNANPIEVSIKAIHKYPEYHPPSSYHDIALFELSEDVKFNKDIRPACLWTKPDFPGYTRAIATGWGVFDTNRPTEYSNVLQKASLTLMQNDFCNQLESLRNIWNRKWQGFREGQLCAGELRGGKDTCQGDSGSPLQVLSRDNNCVFHVIGVTSFGHYCARPGKPAVYTRVSSYLDWIESVVWPGEQ